MRLSCPSLFSYCDALAVGAHPGTSRVFCSQQPGVGRHVAQLIDRLILLYTKATTSSTFIQKSSNQGFLCGPRLLSSFDPEGDTFRQVSGKSDEIDGTRLERTLDAWTLSALNLPVPTEVTGTSDGIVSLAEGCVNGTRVVSCSCTDISSSALTGRLGGTKTCPRRDVASGCCGQKELVLLGSRVLPGSQPVNSSSPASSGASVYVVRSRNMLCGKRLTRSWILMDSVSGSQTTSLAIVLDPVNQQCIQHDFTCHIAQTTFSVHDDSVDCH